MGGSEELLIIESGHESWTGTNLSEDENAQPVIDVASPSFSRFADGVFAIGTGTGTRYMQVQIEVYS